MNSPLFLEGFSWSRALNYFAVIALKILCGPFKSSFHFSFQNEISTPLTYLFFSRDWDAFGSQGKCSSNRWILLVINTVLRSLRLLTPFWCEQEVADFSFMGQVTSLGSSCLNWLVVTFGAAVWRQWHLDFVFCAFSHANCRVSSRDWWKSTCVLGVQEISKYWLFIANIDDSIAAEGMLQLTLDIMCLKGLSFVHC